MKKCSIAARGGISSLLSKILFAIFTMTWRMKKVSRRRKGISSRKDSTRRPLLTTLESFPKQIIVVTVNNQYFVFWETDYFYSPFETRYKSLPLS